MDSSTIDNSNAMWPPVVIDHTNAEAIVNECELMELLPERAQGKQFIAVVEMAALLFQGDLDGAKHLWKRTSSGSTMDQPLLQDWWKVGAGMITSNVEAIWGTLQHIANNHPAPINSYAASVATAYRQRLLRGVDPKLAAMPPLSKLLNFASMEEFQRFVAEHGNESNNSAHRPVGFVDGKTSILQAVSFLETTKKMDEAVRSSAMGKGATKVDPEILA